MMSFAQGLASVNRFGQTKMHAMKQMVQGIAIHVDVFRN